jgi:hypothetical protein
VAICFSETAPWCDASKSNNAKQRSSTWIAGFWVALSFMKVIVARFDYSCITELPPVFRHHMMIGFC